MILIKYNIYFLSFVKLTFIPTVILSTFKMNLIYNILMILDPEWSNIIYFKMS